MEAGENLRMKRSVSVNLAIKLLLRVAKVSLLELYLKNMENGPGFKDWLIALINIVALPRFNTQTNKKQGNLYEDLEIYCLVHKLKQLLEGKTC